LLEHSCCKRFRTEQQTKTFFGKTVRTVFPKRFSPFSKTLGDLQENKILIFEREGWLCQPSLSKMGILLSRRSLDGCAQQFSLWV